MRTTLLTTLAGLVLVVLSSPALAAPGDEMTDAEAAALAQRVKAETKHAWQGYKQYAWGHDDLKPLSKGAHDWYEKSLLMSPVDALDTLILMGLDEEAKEARELIVTRLSFDQDLYVQNFEVTIRLLGGLLSAYQLTGDERLLKLAEDLGKRLLPVFESKTGLPYTHVNLRTGQVKGKVSNPAETGTLLIEFGSLSKLTGNPIYYDKAKRALVETYNRRSKIGLVGAAIDVETGEWTRSDSHIGGGIDSYYEYLYKCWLLFGDAECKKMWDDSIPAVNRYLADEVRDGELWYGRADMNTGKRTATRYGALDAFMPALLALGGDLPRAGRLQDSGLKMWRLHDIEPESLDYSSMKVTSGSYHLRPEIVESAYYLYHFTGDAKYRAMGREFFEDFVRHCRTEHGYAALKDVRTKQQQDAMESFLFAETFKYYYLLFAPRETLDFDSIIFNTEAHPLRRANVAQTTGVGLAPIKVSDPVSGGTMPGFVFYPSTQPAKGDTPVGPYNVAAAFDAPALAGAKPLVVISHGNGGSALGHHDLATYLASHGFMVATIEHPGDNFHDQSGVGHSEVLVGRPIQVSAVISAVLEDPRWKKLIDPNRIGVSGFSAGGYTSLLVVGAVPRFDRFIDYCERHREDKAICGDADRLKAEAAKNGQTLEDLMAAVQKDLTRWGNTSDPRVKAAFAMAPLSLIFDKAGIAKIDRPVFLYYGEKDGVLVPSENTLHIKPLISTLSGITMVPKADHWVFLAPCSAELAKDAGEICRDPAGVDRAKVHKQINADALAFFRKTLDVANP